MAAEPGRADPRCSHHVEGAISANPVLWTLGTFGRSVVFSMIILGVLWYEIWASQQDPGGGPTFSFLLVAPLEFGIAAVWGAVDGWRRLTWTAVLVRWVVVAVVSAVVFAGAQADGSVDSVGEELAGLFGLILLQSALVVGGAALGASVVHDRLSRNSRAT